MQICNDVHDDVDVHHDTFARSDPSRDCVIPKRVTFSEHRDVR